MNLKEIHDIKNCPSCNANWDGGSILDTFIQQREEGVKCWQGKSNEQIEKEMKENYSPPYRWSNVIGIEEDEDRISKWQCPECKTEWKRT